MQWSMVLQSVSRSIESLLTKNTRNSPLTDSEGVKAQIGISRFGQVNGGGIIFEALTD